MDWFWLGKSRKIYGCSHEIVGGNPANVLLHKSIEYRKNYGKVMKLRCPIVKKWNSGKFLSLFLFSQSHQPVTYRYGCKMTPGKDPKAND